METQNPTNNQSFDNDNLRLLKIDENDNLLSKFTREELLNFRETLNEFKTLFKQNSLVNLDDLLAKTVIPVSKKSFLVFKHQKYITVPTENTAFFHVRNESSIMTGFDGEEYTVNYSLEQIQNMLPKRQFFRLNRQYLINFAAIKEVEHYFARKLFVKLAVPVADKLLVSKKKSGSFLNWLEDR